MLTAGIDVGLENIKIVILRDGQVVARASAPSGGGARPRNIEQAWNTALRAAGLSASQVEQVIATGQGKHAVKFATGHSTEPVADARGARFLYPAAGAVVDIGADQVRVVTLGEDDNIPEVVMNQKCAAGLGLFLESMAHRLDMTLEDMGRLAMDGEASLRVNDGCAVFAELDALGLLNRGAAREEVARALMEAVAVRVNSILNDKVKPPPDSTVLVGGVGRNKALVQALQRRSGIKFNVPPEAEYAGALGAAVIGTRSLAHSGRGGR